MQIICSQIEWSDTCHNACTTRNEDPIYVQYYIGIHMANDLWIAIFMRRVLAAFSYHNTKANRASWYCIRFTNEKCGILGTVSL